MTVRAIPDQDRTEILALVGPMLMTAALRRTLPAGGKASANLELYRKRIHDWVGRRIGVRPEAQRASERTRLMALVAEVLLENANAIAEECIADLQQPTSGPSRTAAAANPTSRPQAPLQATQTRPVPTPASPPPLPSQGLRTQPVPTPASPTPVRTHGLRLPSLQELSREQVDILNEAVGSRLLVTGPPGSGKTVMALHRAEKLLRANRISKLVTFNRVLTAYVTNAMKRLELPPESASTYHSWAQKWHEEVFEGRAYPTRNNDRFDIDWMAIARTLRQVPEQENHYLFVDEGQDLPSDFYLVLDLIRPTDLTVFADENQRITGINSTIEEIRTALDIDVDDIIALRKNYRNTRPIAEVAACFHVRGIDTGIPELPDRPGTTPAYHALGDLHAQCKFIARYAKNNPSLEIGVFAKKTQQQEQVFSYLKDDVPDSDIQMYINGDGKYGNASALKMGLAGIKVLNDQSAKGTEVDTVFLVDVDRRQNFSRDQEAMTLFVLCSRARTSLYFLGNTKGLPDALAPARDFITLG